MCGTDETTGFSKFRFVPLLGAILQLIVAIGLLLGSTKG
jgi:hypothetical protein